ncbi:MAG TPA: hypothetical protein VMU22_03525 [Rhizomicrobium sp.]|nr:hypothetical protein [Rhizomicrobium sp.]
MTKRYVLGSMAVLGSILAVGPALAAASDDCKAIATAKFEEWRQNRLFIDRSKTFEDGRVVKDSMIVTENTAYYRQGANPWTSAGITVRERAIQSPEKALAAMRLADCTRGSAATEDGQPAVTYTFSYLPGDDGTVASGTVWISQQTGLPLREEFTQSAPPPANQKVAKTITATYHYNSDVSVPRGAELAEQRRLNNNWAAVRNMQSGGEGMGGPQQ